MQHDVGALTPTGFLVASIVKVVVVFSVTMVVVALLTLLERWISAWMQDRLGPNRVGPKGILQPAADGLKNILKEETDPKEASRAYFFLAPAISIIPALVTFAVVPFAAPLPTPWGLVDMVVADVPIGILFVLALSSLGVYGLVMAGWSSNSKYAFLGGLRASAQMVSYEVALGLSLIPVFMLVGNVTLPQVVWAQQDTFSIWFAFPLGLAFFLFVNAAFAETNRLPFDLPEAEAELVTGYHTEYSSMKFSMFFIAEYSNMLTASALMATLFLGGWDIPFWRGDNMVMVAPGLVMGASPAWWKTLLTFGAFAAKTFLFILLFMVVRWTVPRFRYDQVMHLGLEGPAAHGARLHRPHGHVDPGARWGGHPERIPLRAPADGGEPGRDVRLLLPDRQRSGDRRRDVPAAGRRRGRAQGRHAPGARGRQREDGGVSAMATKQEAAWP